LGIGDWGLGIGDWGLGPIPNPQSPINYIQIKQNNILQLTLASLIELFILFIMQI